MKVLNCVLIIRVCSFWKWVNHLFQAARSLPPLIVPSVVFDMRNYAFNNLCRAGDVCYRGIEIPPLVGCYHEAPGTRPVDQLVNWTWFGSTSPKALKPAERSIYNKINNACLCTLFFL